MILSIAKFASSLTKYNHDDGMFHTEDVMGPDEFHEWFPGAPKAGMKDNAYTNVMIIWTLFKAKEVLSILPETDKVKILKRLELSQRDFSRWDDIAQKMNIIINNKGIISQFDGYFKLKELDWDKYRAKYRNIQRMDRILKAERKLPDEYKVSKQADVLMMFYLLPLSEIVDIFARLGYKFDKNRLKRNYEYYVKRTTHGSSLSKVVHCLVSRQVNMFQESWSWFVQVLESDFYDTQGGTTPEGIHTGVMGGAIDIVMRGFAGINILKDRIRINPRLPKNWQGIKLKFLYKGKQFSLFITKYQVTLLIRGPMRKSITIPVEINKKFHCLPLGKTFKFSLKER